MKKLKLRISFLLPIAFIWSCNVLEKSSRHEFESGYYKLDSGPSSKQDVYVDISENEVGVYPKTGATLGDKMMTIKISNSDSLCHYPVKFSKNSLDIDITSNLLKFRPSVYGLPAQMTFDFNAAIYAGWRHDHYRIRSKQDPLGLCHYEIINRGYDFGLFAGPGTTLIGPFSTRDAVVNEYNGVTLQYGLAGFIESDIASFGISTGFDYLFNKDRSLWIYHRKPWFGFVVGIALN